MATVTDQLVLARLIAQNFNESNSNSLINLAKEINEASYELNSDDKNIFFYKANRIFLKQKKIKKALRKISSSTISHKKFDNLYHEIKRFKYYSKSVRLNEIEILNKQISINNLIQSIMQDIEEDIKSAQGELLENPQEPGIFGLTEKISGDCMPGLQDLKSNCKTDIESMEIVIRKPVNLDDLDHQGALVKKPEFIAKIISDEKGFFEISLEPGIYSLMIKKDDQEICTKEFTDDGIACKIHIDNNSKTFYKATLNEAVW